MKSFFSILIALALSPLALAQELHSKAYLIHDHDAFVSGMNIGVHLDIEKGWHAYWENPGDVGAAPQIQINASVPIQESDLNYPVPSRIEANPYDSFGYENEAMFYKTVRLSPDAQNPSKIHLEIQADWLVCQEICVPCTKTFSIDLPINENAKENNAHFKYFSFPKRADDLQATLTTEGDQNILTLRSSKIQKDQAIDFFPTAAMGEFFNKPISKKVDAGIAIFNYTASKKKDISQATGLLKLNAKEGYWVGEHADTSNPPIASSSEKAPEFWYVFVLAFLGGLLLNLMPCVLPVVSLKLLSLMKSAQEKKQEIRVSNLWFSAGILASLIIFAFVFIGIQSSGEKLGWGFQLQSPGFVTCLIILFFVIGLNLIGFFEIGSIPIPGLGRLLLPNSWTSDFLAGFFTTVVATPCTAPFMAVAIGYALTQNNATIIATFTALGLGLSFPYLLLSLFPNLIHLVPKPGKWMITLKEFLAFPMFLTVAWLTWVLSQLTDDRATLSSLALLTLTVFFFWSKNKIFSKDSLQKKILLLLIAAAIFLVARFPFSQKMDSNIQWEPFNRQKVEALAKSSMVFVDFTADWCLTCKTNERITLSNRAVIDTIQKNKIVMVKADWTKRNPEITEVLKQYDRAGVPFYLLYKPTLTTPVVLPTLLTPSIFMDAVNGKGD